MTKNKARTNTKTKTKTRLEETLSSHPYTFSIHGKDKYKMLQRLNIILIIMVDIWTFWGILEFLELVILCVRTVGGQ